MLTRTTGAKEQTWWKRVAEMACRLARQEHEPTRPMRPDIDCSGSSIRELERLMISYQKADAKALMTLIEVLSPQLYRFFAERAANRTEAEHMLQDAWLRIHRVRHTYRPGAPLLSWVYAIARCVEVDTHRRRRRIESRETRDDGFSEASVERHQARNSQSFEELLTALPEC